MSEELKSCPFCGEKPELQTMGTFIDIECCASMSFQKSDYMDMCSRRKWIESESAYEPEVEAMVLKQVAAIWNTRTPEK